MYSLMFTFYRIMVLSWIIAVLILVFTVPKGIPNILAISSCVNPWKYERSISFLDSSFKVASNFFNPTSDTVGLELRFNPLFSVSIIVWFLWLSRYPLDLTLSIAAFRAMFSIQVNNRPFEESYVFIFFQIFTKTSCSTSPAVSLSGTIWLMIVKRAPE